MGTAELAHFMLELANSRSPAIEDPRGRTRKTSKKVKLYLAFLASLDSGDPSSVYLLAPVKGPSPLPVDPLSASELATTHSLVSDVTIATNHVVVVSYSVADPLFHFPICSHLHLSMVEHDRVY